MGLTKWITSKLILYLMVFAVFYVVGSMMGWIPKPLQDLVSWLSGL